jgi:hypothetical protein
MPKQPMDMDDIKAELKKHGYVAILWSVDDVKEIREDLTDGEAFLVLEQCAHEHDASLGITWDTLRDVAAELFEEAA